MSQNLMTPKGMMALLYDHFEDVHQAAISHVVTDENGDHLYLALIRADGKQHQGGAGPAHKHRPAHTAEAAVADDANGTTSAKLHAAMPAGPNANPAGPVDDLDVSLSRQLVSLLHQPVMWDACTDKQHCGGAGPAHRPRHQHHEARVPAAHAHPSVEGDAAMEASNPATTVSPADVAGLFKVMDRVSAYGLKETPATHGDDAA